MSSVETYRGTVYPWEADHMGHMNVQFYVAKFDAATWQLFGLMGMTPAWLRDNSRGMAAVKQTIEYHEELLPGDLIAVRSEVIEVSTSSTRFRHVMSNCATGEDAATTELIGVHIDLGDRSSRPFPEVIRQRAEAMAAGDGTSAE